MKIVITAKAVNDDRLGRLRKDQVVELIDHKALFYVARGEAILYETKVKQDLPSQAVGAPLSVSPAAQASPQTIASESDSGEKPEPKKRGRKKLFS